MNAMQLLTGPLAQSIGWALLHLLWQAAIVAGILAAVLALLPRQSANARYAASCGALALVFAMFVATAVRSYDPAAAPIEPSSIETNESAMVTLAQVPMLIAETAAASWRDRAMDLVATARQSLPSIVAIWLAGVVLLSSRLLLSWVRARRLTTKGAQEASAEWQHVAARLSEALGLRRAVRLLESAAVEVPSVLGSLRPIILLPASTLTGMTPEQIEMVLAHELAHIRRHDFLVNLLQAFVETLMFYHPAVWWMSRRVRVERENCCDDLAVAVCGDPIQYARALTRLEELRADALPVVVAANGGSLLDRIRRIAHGRAESTGMSSRWAAAVAMLLILGVALAVPSLPALAQREEPAKKEEAPKPASTKIEVVEAAPAEDDVDSDTDFAFAIEPPEPPEPPEMPELPDVVIEIPDIPMPAIAPMVAFTPAPPAVPAIAPRAVVAPTPRPTVPPAPPALAMVMSNDWDFDFEDDEPEAKQKDFGASGKLTVDELIKLRSVGVTAEYVKAMRAILPGVSLREITSLRAVGVTPQYVEEIRNAGLDAKTARDFQGLRAVGVDAKYVAEMRSAGLDVKTARDFQSLRAVGVDAKYVAEMRNAGLDVKTARDFQQLRAVGVTAEYVKSMRAAGVEIKSSRDATSLRSMSVTPQFVKQLADAGYTNLSVRELTRLAAVGIDGDFIREMEKYREKK